MHYVSRDREFIPTAENYPLPLKYLGRQRITKLADGRIVRDKWTRTSTCPQLHGYDWTGYTRFKIQTPHRKEARACFQNKSNGTETIYMQEDKAHTPLSERTMSLSDRLKFKEVKQKELSSFFENDVWVFDDEVNAKTGRVLRARFILNWKTNPDGSPRAKARLICQGFKDPDALNGTLTTASPTLTRLARNFILSVTSLLGYDPFTANISTAFLQGKSYDPTSERELWVRLPREADDLLGLPAGHGRVMKLTKPMYALVDAPKTWFDEAVERILKLGRGSIMQHPLDACLFLAFDRPIQLQLDDVEAVPRLIAIFGIHVDDLLGCCDEKNSETKILMDKLRATFTFREWHSGADRTELTYCGAKIVKVAESHWKLHHTEYRQQKNVPVTEGERTALRGLLGALQWPSTQTCPWLQVSVSMLAGAVSTATTATLLEANKTLRYAKQHADVELEFRCLGPKEGVTFVVFSDASFASRPDHSSQGGYLVLMVDSATAAGAEGHYNVIDWRSWKLERISRSTLAAESQAASEAANALLFTTTFWNLIWKPWLVLDDLKTAKMNGSSLVVDAKALFDLLSKPEVQASSGTDKRTTIEVLVSQDKLACSGSETKWVSSELQYANGLTKQSAAQLLAERLRTHLVRLRSDINFQAAKKKTAQERKKNAEMFALKKPQRAMQAMFAMCWTTSSATNINNTNDTTFTYNDLYPGMFQLLYTLIIAIAMGFVMMGSWKIWKRAELLGQAAEDETLKEDSMPAVSPRETTAEMEGIPTIRRDAEAQTEIEMHEVVRFQEYFDETQRLESHIEHNTMPNHIYDAMVATLHRELDIYYEALYDRLREQEYQHRVNLHTLTEHQCFSREAADAGIQIQNISADMQRRTSRRRASVRGALILWAESWSQSTSQALLLPTESRNFHQDFSHFHQCDLSATQINFASFHLGWPFPLCHPHCPFGGSMPILRVHNRA
eukprot:s155_g9.t1